MWINIYGKKKKQKSSFSIQLMTNTLPIRIFLYLSYKKKYCSCYTWFFLVFFFRDIDSIYGYSYLYLHRRSKKTLLLKVNRNDRLILLFSLPVHRFSNNIFTYDIIPLYGGVHECYSSPPLAPLHLVGLNICFMSICLVINLEMYIAHQPSYKENVAWFVERQLAFLKIHIVPGLG